MRILSIISVVTILISSLFTSFNAGSETFFSNEVLAQESRSAENFTLINPYPTSNDLSNIAWNPGGTEALIIGSGETLFSYDGKSFTQIFIDPFPKYGFSDIKWKPDGSYALISGSYRVGIEHTSILAKYSNGRVFEVIENNTIIGFKGISWKPDGSCALLAGTNSMYKFDGINVEVIPLPSIPPENRTANPYDVDWKPDGSYALIVGDHGLVFRYDGKNVTPVAGAPVMFMYGVAWRSQGDYALIVGNGGTILKYNGILITQIPTLTDDTYYDVDWDHNGDYAYIVGSHVDQFTSVWSGVALTYANFTFPPTASPIKTYESEYQLMGVCAGNKNENPITVGYGGMIYEHDGEKLKALSSGFRYDLLCTEWKPDASYALISTRGGLLYKYDGTDFSILYSNPDYQLSSISWNTGGTLALIVGGNLTLVFDGTNFKEIITPDKSFSDAAWRPGDDIALIVDSKTVALYNNSEIEIIYEIDSTDIYILEDAVWSPEGDQALLVSFWDAAVFLYKHDQRTVEMLNKKAGYLLHSADWNSEGTMAIMVGYQNGYSNEGLIATYDGNYVQYSRLGWEFRLLAGVKWFPDKNSAFIVNGEGGAFVYTEGSLETLDTGCSSELNHVSWNPKSGDALIVGEHGTVLSYNYGSVIKNRMPVIEITEPLDQAVLEETVKIKVGAYDPDPSDIIDKVEIRFRNSSWASPWLAGTGTNSWSYSWDTTTVSNGIYTISARTYDGKLYSNISSVTVNVKNRINTRPVCTITHPTDGSILEGIHTIFGISADNDEGDLVVRNDLSLFNSTWDSGWLSIQGSGSWTYKWDTRLVSDGQYTINARAFDGELYSDNSTVSVQVKNKIDNKKPFCSITKPSPYEVIEGTIVISGTASEPDDGDEVTEVLIQINGNWYKATGTANWQYEWDTLTVANGDYTISAKSSDGELFSDIAFVEITVNNKVSFNSKPEITINYPAWNETVYGTVELSGVATDIDGDDSLTRVEIRITNDSWQGSWDRADGTVSWNYQWYTETYRDGLYTVYVRAYDGELFSSVASVDVIVDNIIDNKRPNCVIVYPDNNSSVSGIISVEVSVTDLDGEIASVQVRLDNGDWMDMTRSKKNKYEFILDTTTLENSLHTISARAYDGYDFSFIAKIDIIVDNTVPGEIKSTQMDNKNYLYLSIAVIAVVMIFIGIFAALNKKGGKGKESDDLEVAIEVTIIDDEKK